MTEKYSTSKHEWGTDASTARAKSLTPGEEKKKKVATRKEDFKELEERSPSEKANYAWTKMLHRKEYKSAYDALMKLIGRSGGKQVSGKTKQSPKHSIDYLAAKVAQSYTNVDGKTLANMLPKNFTFEGVEEKESLQPFAEHVDFKTWTDTQETVIYHLQNNIPLGELYRVGSKSYYQVFNEARILHNEDKVNLSGANLWFVESDIGFFAEHNGEMVPLDSPMIEEEDEKGPELGKPKAGGPKKYYVHVKDPSSGNIKKVSWGDTTGLKIKLNDPEARKSFAARHQCSTKNDKTMPGYWACRMPYFAKQLGLSGGGNFFW